MRYNLDDEEVATKSLMFLDKFLLGVHIVFFLFFLFVHVNIMTVVNIFSILIYVYNFQLIKKKKTTACILITFFEIMVHMFMVVICVGWGSGFQLYFIGCIAAVFFADYFSVRLGNHSIAGVALSVVSGLLYFIAMRISYNSKPVYELHHTVENVMLVLNSIVVFVVCTYFYSLLTGIANYYEEELSKQANHDKLTGLVNRFYLIDHLQKVYEAGKIKNYWLAIVDIDDFKAINDLHGHNCGDFVLKSMAAIIASSCGDLIACRWGGEEFVMVGEVPGGADSECAMLEEIRKTVAEREFVYDGNRIKLTITIGAAPYIEGQTVDEWINVADEKLYTGKHTGKNRLVF